MNNTRIAFSLLAATTIAALNACAGEPQELGTNQSGAALGAGPSVNGKHVVDELLIQFAPGASASAKANARGKAGAAQLETIRAGAEGELELARLPPGKAVADAVHDLSGDSAVVFAEPNYIYEHAGEPPTDPYYVNKTLWGIRQKDEPTATHDASDFDIDATEAWATTAGSANVYVGVIDEGIQFTHPDLAANVWTNTAETAGNKIDDDGNGYVDDVRGWDFASNDATVYDGGTKGTTDRHGTHVAGTIGAAANGQGVVGVNHTVTLIPLKFLGRTGGTSANAIKALDYLTRLKTVRGLNVVASNNSWGGGGYSRALLDAITRSNAADILFIAAAGNGGTDGIGDNNDTVISYPSGYNLPNVIAVAAIISSGALASYSNYGATTVDLGAPGSGIISTYPFNKYASLSGTSMATPHVTGVAALVAAANPALSAAKVKEILLGTVDQRVSLATRTVTGGTVNARKAVLAAAACASPEVCDGQDNDCDGVIDDGTMAGVGVSCGTDVGECTSATTTCAGVGGITCSAVGPSPEVCDGKDNNCDGAIDDSPSDVGVSCGIGIGACTGTTTCTDGAPTCTAPEPAPEVCGDGVDSDCNGEDEVCSLTCTPSTPTTEVCGDGVDNDCDGVVDNDDCVPS